jgi:hypothetical protein
MKPKVTVNVMPTTSTEKGDEYLMKYKKQFTLDVLEGDNKLAMQIDNSGQDQTPLINDLCKFLENRSFSEDRLMILGTLDGKTGFEDKTEKKYTYDEKFKTEFEKIYISEMKEFALVSKEKPNMAAFVRCVCLTRIGAYRKLIEKFPAKLGASRTLVYYFTRTEIIGVLNEQIGVAAAIMKGQSKEKIRDFYGYTKPMSLYTLLDTPNPKEISLSENETIIVVGKLKEIAGMIKIELKKFIEEQKTELINVAQLITDSELNDKWRDVFTPLKSSGVTATLTKSKIVDLLK